MEPVNPLGAEARARLAAYRREMPSTAAFQRDWARITAAIDDADHVTDDHDGAPIDDLDAAPTARHDSTRRWAIAAGLAFAIAAAVLLLLRGVIGAATALGLRSPAPMEAVDRAAEPPEHASRARQPGARSEAASTLARTPDPAADDARGEAEAADAEDPIAPAATPSATPPGPAPVPTASAERDAARLAEETALLREAREALAAGDREGALRSLDLHEQRFPAGALLEERMLYRAIAGCRGGEPEPAEAFVRRFPRSPHAPRVRRECGQAP